MLWIGNAVSKVSTFAMATARLDLNLSKFALGLAIGVVACGVSGLGSVSILLVAGLSAVSFASLVIG